MITVNLVILPGVGARTCTVQRGTTLNELASDYNITDRTITYNDQPVSLQTHGHLALSEGDEIFANKSVKGN